MIATRAGWNGDVLGQGSGRSAPVAHPRTRSRRRNALRPAHDCHLPRVRNFQLPGMRSFRVPLTVGRGNRHQDLRRDVDCRSIPAWAGKPCQAINAGARGWVHPRVGGETRQAVTILGPENAGAVHPRVGGETSRSRREVERSIPAWAGKPVRTGHAAICGGPSPRGRGNLVTAGGLTAYEDPRSGKRARALHGVHPRVGGETGRTATFAAGIRRGVHPRVGGETSATRYRLRARSGPSPRGRGNRRSPRSEDLAMSVHPRVGGETRAGRCPVRTARGPSPRGRGNRYRAAPRGFMGPSPRGRGNHKGEQGISAIVGSIPAWAGKPGGTHPGTRHQHGVHPRVGGETRPSLVAVGRRRRVHPRVGGETSIRARRTGTLQTGSIPAWAGKPPAAEPNRSAIRVHPRVGGETALRHPHGRYAHGVHPRVGGETQVTMRNGNALTGPSPRGRGNHPRPPHREVVPGSIPAWAGKPTSRRSLTSKPVHPRVGGETRNDGSLLWAGVTGPSPRGRGNQHIPIGRRSSRGPSPRGRGNLPVARPRSK